MQTKTKRPGLTSILNNRKAIKEAFNGSRGNQLRRRNIRKVSA